MSDLAFCVKPIGKLTASDFEQSPIWAGYYEPGDVEAIVGLGIPEPIVLAALDAVDWQDDHYFPLPMEAQDSHWVRGKMFSVTATTASGSKLAGWVWEGTHSLVNLFLDGDQYVLTADTPNECDRLAARLDEKTLFPLTVENSVTGEHWVYPGS